jgi:hypothetical protein
VKLNLALRVKDDPSDDVWRRTVERPYAGVPAVGDWVFLDDEGTKAKPVTRVTWSNEGEVTLGFGAIDETPESIHAFGFARADL